MGSDFIAIEVQGVEAVKDYLRRLPPLIQDAAVDAASKYLINVYHAYPSQKYVSRAEAFPGVFAVTPTGKRIQGYFSWAQFKKVMALWSEGHVPYKRTQTLSRGWKQVGSGRTSFIVNETPYAWAVMGQGEQSRHMTAIGWKDIQAIAEERADEVLRRAAAAVDKAIKSAG